MKNRQHGHPTLVQRLCLVAILQTFAIVVSAQTTVTIDSAHQAPGVSPSADVVFTFSGPMNTATVNVSFYTISPPGFYTVTSAWNNSNDILTCSPTTPFPANTSISWVVSGMDANAMQVIGQGSFTTGTGSGGGSTGYGTNRISSFVAGKVYLFAQGSAGSPVPSGTEPFIFSGSAVLASNRTATSITLTLPNAAVSNLVQQPFAMEDYNLIYYNSSSNALESTFPQGTYTFTVNAATSNQTIAVTLPSAQPNPPQISNHAAAQAVDVSKPFMLSWNPFVGGTSSDYIFVTIGNWASGQVGATNALDGTATSVAIPAGALVANSNYTASVGFEHGTFTTNSTYSAGAFRSTVTGFNLNTVGTSSPLPVVSNPIWNGHSLDFDIDTVSGQTLTVVYSTDCSMPVAQWSKLLTTNSPGTRVHISDSGSVNAPVTFYAVRNGP